MQAEQPRDRRSRRASRCSSTGTNRWAVIPASPVKICGNSASAVSSPYRCATDTANAAQEQVALDRDLLQHDHERAVREIFELEVGIEVAGVVVPTSGLGARPPGSSIGTPAIFDRSTIARYGCASTAS